MIWHDDPGYRIDPFVFMGSPELGDQQTAHLPVAEYATALMSKRSD